MTALAIGTRVRVTGCTGTFHFLLTGTEATVLDPFDDSTSPIGAPGSLVTDRHVYVRPDDVPEHVQVLSIEDVEVL